MFLLSFANVTGRTRKKWRKRAAHKGHGEAFNLVFDGYLVYDVDGFAERRAEEGCPHAQSTLGVRLATQEPPDLVRSRYWYHQAALGGSPSGMYETGLNFLLGDGGERNVVQALEWLEKAALEAHEDACWVLADVYTKGLAELKKDPERAAHWLKMWKDLREA